MILLKWFFIVFVSFVFFQDVRGFDYKACAKDTNKYGPGGFITSSGQFTSSTGGCAMIGMANYDKKVFLVQNFENMKNDSARGGGEYIEAYAIVSMCDQAARNELSRAFQKNFTYIYGESLEKEPEQVYEAMERVMKKDSILVTGCYRKM